MKSPPKMPQRAMVRIWVASLHQELRYPMGIGVSILLALQKGLHGWIRTASTRRIVRRVKKPLRGFFRCAARAIHPRPPRTPVSNGYRSFCFIYLEKGDARVDSNSIDPPNSPAGKKPLCNSDDRCQRQKQGGAVGAAASRMRVPPKARCSRWEPRPGFLFCAARAIHPRPPKNRNVSKYAAILFYDTFFLLFLLRPPIRAAVLECCFAQ